MCHKYISCSHDTGHSTRSNTDNSIHSKFLVVSQKNTQAQSAKAEKELHIYIISCLESFFVLNSSGGIQKKFISFSSVFHLKSSGHKAFVTTNDVDVQYIFCFGTLCLCVQYTVLYMHCAITQCCTCIVLSHVLPVMCSSPHSANDNL